MRPTLRLATSSLIALSLIATACGRTASETPSGESFICTDCEASSDSTTGETEPDSDDSNASPVGVAPKAPDAIDEPGRPETCGARAPVREPTEVPELPEKASDPSCRLTGVRHDTDGDGTAERETQWSRGDGSVIKHTEGPGEEFETIHWVPGLGDHLRSVSRQRRTGPGPEVDVDLWQFDAEGRLVRERHARLPKKGADTPERLHQIEQTFRDGRLVERTEVEKPHGGSRSRTTTTYDYEHGRLVGATHTAGDDRWRAEWTYDEGRLTDATYTLNGRRAFTQSWQYRTDGRLESRTLDVRDPLVDEQGSRRRLPPLAEMTPTSTPSLISRSSDTPYWERATFTRRGDCRRLPSSLGHGYPTSERVYRAAFHDGSVPRGADHAYGSPGYGIWGDRAWYGHTGLFSTWPVARPDLAPEGEGVAITVDYDERERMIRETATFDTDDGPDVRVRRARTFAGGQLVEDRVMKRRGEIARRRALTFRYDDDRLVRRALRIGGHIAEKQSWTVRNGRDVELTIAYRRDRKGRVTWDETAPSAEAPFETTTYHREFDDRGRRTRFAVEPNGLYVSEIRTRYSEHGPVERVERQGDFEERTRFVYDEAGRRIAKNVDRDNDGNFEWDERWTYDTDGRLVEFERRRESRGVTTRRERQYACH